MSVTVPLSDYGEIATWYPRHDGDRDAFIESMRVLVRSKNLSLVKDVPAALAGAVEDALTGPDGGDGA